MIDIYHKVVKTHTIHWNVEYIQIHKKNILPIHKMEKKIKAKH
jgi:DNA-binding ferritin-like protein